MHLGSAFDSAAKAHIKAQGAKAIGCPLDLAEPVSRTRVESKPISFPEHGINLVVRGNLDQAFTTTDDGFVIVDFKAGSSDPTEFWAQLMLYLWAVENPAKDTPQEVEAIGIIGLDFSAPSLKISESNQAALIGSIAWHSLEIDRERLLKKMDDVASVAAASSPPDAGKWCDFCRSVELAKEGDLKKVAA